MDVDRAKARAALLLRQLDKVLVEDAKNASLAGDNVEDSLGAVLLALVVHANVYVRILTERGVTDHDMDVLADLSADWSDAIWEGYVTSSVVDPGRVVKGPSEEN